MCAIKPRGLSNSAALARDGLKEIALSLVVLARIREKSRATEPRRSRLSSTMDDVGHGTAARGEKYWTLAIDSC